MRIGFVTGEYPPMQGGIGAHCRVLAQTLIEQGHEVFIMTSKQASEPTPRIHLNNTVTRWGYGAMHAVKAWAQRERLDIVNLHYQTAAFDMSPYIHFMPDFLRPIPFVTTFHDLRFPYLFPKAGRLRDWIVMRLARASHGIISTNHEDLQRLNHLPLSALIPIGSSVNIELPADFKRQTWRQRAGASERDFLIAHFGFINHSKGVDVLLDSLTLLKEYPVKLVMIGGRTGTSDPTNAAYADTIDRKISELGLNVCWTGFVDDQAVSAYFASSDCVVLPFRDGASYRRSSLMAAIHHTAAIITTQPVIKISAFKNGENLLLVPPGEASALADAMKTVINAPDLRQQLHKGAAELKTVFDWDTIARENVQFFQRAAAR